MKNGRLPLTFNGLLPAVEFKNFPAAPETSGTQQPIFLWSTPSWGSTMEAGSIARVSGSFSFRSLKSILKESTHYYRRLLYECIIIKLSKHNSATSAREIVGIPFISSFSPTLYLPVPGVSVIRTG